MAKTPKERLQEAWESWKKAVKNIAYVINNTLAAIWNTFKALWQWLDAWDKAVWNAIEKKMKTKGKNTTNTVSSFIRNNIFKLLLAVSVATYWWVEIAQKVKDKHEDPSEIVEWWYIEKFWNGDKIFIIDVSENNSFDKEKFAKWNKDRRDSKKEDVRWVSWVYMRVQKEWWADPDFQGFFEWIKEFNETAEKWQQIAVWWYVYFNKSEVAITDEWIDNQVDAAVNRLAIINNDSDGVVDLIPMLDFEFSNAEMKRWRKDHTKEDYPPATSDEWWKLKKAVLKRLETYEKKTWITPWIYTWWSLYYDYFLDDPDFLKYPIWIATYNWKRVDQSEDWHSVKIWPVNNTTEIQPDLVQFSDNIKRSWFWTSNWSLDWNSTTKDKFKGLIVKNGDAPIDLGDIYITDEASKNK